MRMSSHALSIFHGLAVGIMFIGTLGFAIDARDPIVLVGIQLIAIAVWGLGSSLNNYLTYKEH
jgi:hypothetical protein